MSLGGGLVEPSLAVGALHVVVVGRRLGRGQVSHVAAGINVSLRTLGLTDVVDELFVLFAPVFLLRRL